MARLEIVVGRIETLDVDAVVNAANVELRPGTGVDGALRRAAGPALTQLTDTMAPIAEGDAVMTPGFALPARAIFHTAAPIWFLPGDDLEKIATLSRCYRTCIQLAAQHDFKSIAFPCLGTGNFAWPREIARDVAIEATQQALVGAPSIKRVVFCCFTEDDAAIYRARLN